MSPSSRRYHRRNLYSPSPRTTNSFNWQLLLITIAVGIVAWVIDAIIYTVCSSIVAMPLLIGMIFAILFFSLVVTVCLYSILTDQFEENILTGSNDFVGTVIFIVIALFIVFILSALFQWIYGTDFINEVQEATSYIFVIDDSGSMAANDPQQLRYEAVESVLESVDSDFSYMIYSFSNDAKIVRNMSSVSDGIPQLAGESSGGTAIKATLEKVLQDKIDGVWDGGSYPKVILLTDGYASDVGAFSSINSVLRAYIKEGVSISTVGLGNVDTSLMNKIAKTTGGVFIDVSDASDLNGAMITAATQYTSRDLLSTRYTTNLNFLYALLRIVFLFILGSAIGFSTTIAYGSIESFSVIIVSSVIESILGAIIMEVCTDLGVSDKLAWFILWVLISSTVAIKQVVYRTGPRRPSRNRSARNLL